MAVAHAAGLEFVRAEGFAFAHVADEGVIQSSAAELLYLGSGVDERNLPEVYPSGDGFIVGSALKEDDEWSRRIDPGRVGRFMAVHDALSTQQE
jgi:predicted TIM-barrel enzyme